MWATTPVTTGVAIDVPLLRSVPHWPDRQGTVERISAPGAAMLTQRLDVLVGALWPVLVTEATEITSECIAGISGALRLANLSPLLPAAATITTLLVVARWRAVSSVVGNGVALVPHPAYGHVDDVGAVLHGPLDGLNEGHHVLGAVAVMGRVGQRHLDRHDPGAGRNAGHRELVARFRRCDARHMGAVGIQVLPVARVARTHNVVVQVSRGRSRPRCR